MADGGEGVPQGRALRARQHGGGRADAREDRLALGC